MPSIRGACYTFASVRDGWHVMCDCHCSRFGSAVVVARSFVVVVCRGLIQLPPSDSTIGVVDSPSRVHKNIIVYGARRTTAATRRRAPDRPTFCCVNVNATQRAQPSVSVSSVSAVLAVPAVLRWPYKRVVSARASADCVSRSIHLELCFARVHERAHYYSTPATGQRAATLAC